LFGSDIDVEHISSYSSQSIVFFGRETSLGIRVVLKQFSKMERKAMLSEVKIFTRLDNLRNQMADNKLQNHLTAQSSDLRHLPVMLGYKSNKTVSEILMTHGGNELTPWIAKLTEMRWKVNFAAELLRQMIKALKVLHGIGYSHGDLKPENICARKTQS
jgi:serine/threonine protein kinase